MPNFTLVTPDDEAPSRKVMREARILQERLADDLVLTTDPANSNRILGKALIIFTEVLGYKNATAWAIVRPNSTASDEAAANMVSRWKKWYREKYPLTISEAVEVSGLTIEELIDKLREMVNATKWVWDNDKSTYVKTDIPDHATRLRAIVEVRKWVEMDKAALEQATQGKKEKPMQLDLPTVNAPIQEWEEWAQGEEADVLADRTKAAEEMKLIAEGQRALREKGKDAMPDRE